ncbi:nucleoprotein TPR-like [Mercenaria mercenaria]|uniref:nucleoprotein TPR-like n=1 Tax=Mercenaria mercenaria TaxID=6596 RepID=UPI00234F0BD9|nr:nucleoprotein TPR-like [Mercenaria mercenaria]XP_053389402.1 nucleoprotein TPR-like [Mercenaria mercenaria]
MGNTNVSKAQVEKCLEKEKIIDASMVSLAYSLDCWYASAGVLTEYLKSQETHSPDATARSTLDNQRLFLDQQMLLMTTVLHNKDNAAQSLCDFLHFTRESIRLIECTNIKDSPGLTLDKYLSKSNEFQPVFEKATRGLVEQNRQLKEDIEFCNRNERSLREENTILTEKNIVLEALSDNLRTEKEKLEKQTFELREKVWTITNETKVSQQLVETLKAELTNVVADKNKEIKRYMSSETEKDKRVENLIAELEQSKKVRAELETNLTAQQQRHSKHIDEKDYEIERLKTEINKKEDERIHFNTAKLKHDFQKLTHEFQEKTNTLKSAEQEVSKLQLQIQEMESFRSQTENLTTENQKLKKQLQQAQAGFSCETERLSTETKKLEQQLHETQRNLSSETERLSTENKKLEQQLHETQRNLSSEIERLSAENKKLEQQLHETQRNLSSETERLSKEKQLLQQAQRDFSSETERLSTEKQNMKQQLEQARTDFISETERLSTERETLKQQLQDTQSDLESHKEKNKLYLKTIIEEKEKKKCLETERDEFANLIQRKEKDLEELQIQLSAINHANSELKENMESAASTISSLKRSNTRLLEDKNNLKQELEKFKSKRVIQVQIYYTRRGGLITTVEEELICLLKSKMDQEGKLELEFIKRMNATDVNPNMPLLLLCICASRIGTDAANTIQGLNITSKMSLLIFHHKDEHALPNQASYQVLTGKEYTMLGGVCDFAFLTGKGIYTCPMNNASIEKIINFIHSEGERKFSDSK